MTAKAGGQRHPLLAKVTLAVIALVILALGDYVIGLLTGLGDIRQEARMFNEEVSSLKIRVKTLVPNVRHEYEEPWRPEGEKYIPRSELRRFRTDTSGAVSGYEDSPATGNVYRIVFAGDSVTEASEVDEQYRFPYLVQKLLHKQGFSSVRTSNYGVRSHTTQDLLNLLVNTTLHRQGNMLAIMYNVNDRQWLAEVGHYTRTPSLVPVLSFDSWLRTCIESFKDAKKSLYLRSNILFGCSLLLERLRGDEMDEDDDTELGAEIVAQQCALFRDNLRLIIAACRVYGIRPVLMTQPLGEPSNAHAAFNDVIFRVAMEEQADLIDVDKGLTGDRPVLFFPDLVHLNNDGSMAVAQIVADGLAGILKESSSCASANGGGEWTSVLSGPYRYPSLSRDGHTMLVQRFGDSRADVCTMEIGSNTIRHITSEETEDLHPVFFGRKEKSILCTRGHGWSRILTVIDKNSGVTVATLLPTNLVQCIPCYSDSRNSIVFAGWYLSPNSKSKEEPPDLFELDLKNKALRRLTDTPWEEWRPVYVPGHDEILYISNQFGSFDIFSLSLDTAITQLVYSSRMDEWDPTVSPDGQFVAFATKQWGSWDLALVDLQTHSMLRLTDAAGDEYDPFFSPLDSQLFFAVNSPMATGVCSIAVPKWDVR